jgi:TrkA domain protein
VDIIRDTVPATGTVHHCLTRGGQRFALVVDKAERRMLVVYGSADLDVATQTVILDHDEADQIASVLQSRSVADRLAFLERRVAELTEEAS